MSWGGYQKEKFTRRIHLLVGTFCFVMAVYCTVPFFFLKDSIDFYYKGVESAHIASTYALILQKAEAALAMLANGLDIALVSRCTGLSEQQIRDLQKS